MTHCETARAAKTSVLAAMLCALLAVMGSFTVQAAHSSPSSSVGFSSSTFTHSGAAFTPGTTLTSYDHTPGGSPEDVFINKKMFDSKSDRVNESILFYSVLIAIIILFFLSIWYIVAAFRRLMHVKTYARYVPVQQVDAGSVQIPMQPINNVKGGSGGVGYVYGGMAVLTIGMLCMVVTVDAQTSATSTTTLTSTPTPSRTPSRTSTMTGTASNSATPSRTPSRTGSNLPSSTATPTKSPTTTASASETPSGSNSPSVSPTTTTTLTSTPSPSTTATDTSSASPTPSTTSTSSESTTTTASASVTPSTTSTSSESTTTTASASVTPSTTSTASESSSSTPSGSNTPSSSPSHSGTPSGSTTRTHSSTPTPSRTPSATFVHQCIDDADCGTTDACILSRRCVAYVCVEETISCFDDNPCTYDACDQILGCLNPPHDGISCEDDNSCTVDDVCTDGECAGTAVADGTICDDGNACTDDDICTAGVCVGTVIDCELGGSLCLISGCNAALGCVYLPVVCPDDGNALTLEVCDTNTGGCISIARDPFTHTQVQMLHQPWWAISIVFYVDIAFFGVGFVIDVVAFFMNGGRVVRINN